MSTYYIVVEGYSSAPSSGDVDITQDLLLIAMEMLLQGQVEQPEQQQAEVLVMTLVCMLWTVFAMIGQV